MSALLFDGRQNAFASRTNRLLAVVGVAIRRLWARLASRFSTDDTVALQAVAITLAAGATSAPWKRETETAAVDAIEEAVAEERIGSPFPQRELLGREEAGGLRLAGNGVDVATDVEAESHEQRDGPAASSTDGGSTTEADDS